MTSRPGVVSKRRLLSAELKWRAIEPDVGGCQLLDLDILIFPNLNKVLSCATRWPPDVDRDAVRVRPQPDVLLHRISSKGARLTHNPVQRPGRTHARSAPSP